MALEEAREQGGEGLETDWIDHGARWGASLRCMGLCVCLSKSVLVLVCEAEREDKVGSENLTSTAGTARTVLCLSFAFCKMGHNRCLHLVQ